MAKNVKKATTAAASRNEVLRRTPVAKTTISSKHQVTIAKRPFDEAGLRAGDVLAVRAVGPGRVELTSLDALFARYRGTLDGATEFRGAVQQMRDEWP